MYKNLENIFKYLSPADKSATSHSEGEVLNSVFNASTRSVIFRQYSLLEVPRRGIHNAIATAMSICVAFSNKVMDTHLPLPVGSGDKYDVGSVQCGRSMIEMLGVLAIIAVLSVGGIAGYSKAMDMYKINKYKSGMYELIGGFLQIKDELGYTKGGYTRGYAKIMKDLDMMPEVFSIHGDDIKDNFGINFFMYVDNRNGNSHFGFMYWFGVNKYSPKVCQAFVETAVHFSADIWQLYRQPFAGEGMSYYVTYGDHYCKKNLKCLKNLTRADIQELCYAYKDKDPKKYQFAIQMVFKI